MQGSESPSWLDKTGIGVIGTITLDDGTQVTRECVSFDEDSDELIVRVISSSPSDSDGSEQDRAIPSSRILSFEPQSSNTQPWPYSDPCRGGAFSLARFALMTTIFLLLVPGGLFLFILFMSKDPYRLQGLSAVSYTLFEVFFTFAATRGARAYLFTCPAIQPLYPRLLLRHLGFLLALFALQTAALTLRPSLPEWWNLADAKGSTPFEIVVLLLCIGLGYTQVFFNRSLLDRAHKEFSQNAMTGSDRPPAA